MGAALTDTSKETVKYAGSTPANSTRGCSRARRLDFALTDCVHTPVKPPVQLRATSLSYRMFLCEFFPYRMFLCGFLFNSEDYYYHDLS